MAEIRPSVFGLSLSHMGSFAYVITSRRPALTVALACALMLAFASTASAEPTAPVAEPATAAVSAAATPRFSMGTTGVYNYRGRRYILPRTLIEVRGSVNADLGDGIITLVIKRKGRTIKTDKVRVETRGGKSSFSVKYRPKKKGKYVFTVDLTEAQMALASAGSGVGVTAVRTNIRRGQKGVAVRVFQAKLAALNFVVPRNGKYNEATARAFMAYRKNSFMPRNFSAGSAVARKLASGKGGFNLKYPNAGRHVEVDIKRQVMALADNGRVSAVYHVSTGAQATPTIRGTYRVYRKDWGTNAKGMVHSAYFIRGYAIHGFKSVPNYGASHGCVRVPIPDAASIFNWINMGTRIDTYY